MMVRVETQEGLPSPDSVGTGRQAQESDRVVSTAAQETALTSFLNLSGPRSVQSYLRGILSR
jgi:hypothetical protein